MKNVKVSLLLILSICVTHAWADPPARVGRIAYVEGNVEFRDLASNDSNPAALNWPVTSNTMLATGGRSRAEVSVGSAAVKLDENSELEIVRLDDTHVVLQLNRGTAIAHVRDSVLADEFELDTPQGSVRLDGPSEVRIDVDALDADSVQVFSGRARYDNADSGLPISAGHRMEVSQGDIHMSENRTDDDFDDWSAERDQHEETSTAVQYVSPETTGYEELDRYGNWETTAEYGALWYPYTVSAGWAPYRDGRWVWVQPWGWTWVDNAPWGYAPSHYGRWVRYRNRWCWAPGTRVTAPVWAPALVGWVGGNGWNISLSVGSAPTVGWFPLAPHEVYVPSYRVSPAYVRQVNIAHVPRIENITYVDGRPSVPARAHYRNREVHEAITMMPRDRFERNRTVAFPAGAAHGAAERAWRNAPVSATAPYSTHHHEFQRNGGTASPRFSVTRQIVVPAAPAPAASAHPAPRYSEPPTMEKHRHMENRSWSHAGVPDARSRSSSSTISHTVILPQDRHVQPNAPSAAPFQVPMHAEPQMRREPPQQPAPVHEAHGFAQPFSGVQPGSIERARIQGMPGSRDGRPPASQPNEAGHRDEKQERRPYGGDHHRDEQGPGRH